MPSIGNRPGIKIKTGDRSIQPGQSNRPKLGLDQKASTLPGRISGQTNRPNIKPRELPSLKPAENGRELNLPGITNRARTGNTPTTLPERRSTIKDRLNDGNLPKTLPGLSGRVSGNRIGVANPADRSGRDGLSDRKARPTQVLKPKSRDERLDSLSKRLADRDFSRDRVIDRDRDLNLNRDFDRNRDIIRDGDFNRNRSFDRDFLNARWDRHRHDRHDRWRNRHWHHHHWHYGFSPLYRPGYWGGFWWNRYPVLSVFGITNWSVNRCGWSTGYYSYYNPYATPYVINQTSVYYNYSEPIQIVEDAPIVASDETISTFDRAMQEFYEGHYETSLASTNEALKELPNDAAVHEFRALVLFALGRYEESAATLYAVLSVGPGWDWTTMSGLYPSVDIYTSQLRSLEEYRNAHPDEPSSRFVLAYHYVTTGHDEAAASQLEKIVELNPKDELSRNLLLSLDPDADVPKPDIPKPPKPAVPIQKAQLVGQWAAQRGGDQFVMNLQENGDFTWTYTPSNGEESKVTGVWAVDEESVIALDMGEDNVMLAQLNLTDGNLEFYMLGDTKGAEPLKFVK